MSVRFRAIILGIMIVLLAGCSKNSTGVTEKQAPQLYFLPDNTTVSVGNDSDFSLMISNLATPVFAVSLRLYYDDAVVSFSDSSGFAASNFFGTDAIRFAHQEDSVIYLSITRIKGQNGVSGSGVVGTLTFGGRSAGTSTIRIDPDELHFYDSLGKIITVANLELKELVIQCVATR